MLLVHPPRLLLGKEQPMRRYEQTTFPGISAPKTPIKALSPEETSQLLHHLSTGYARNFMLVKLALYTGLRNAELLALNVEDIAPFGDVARELELPARAAKGGHPRAIPLHTTLVDDLREFLAWKRARSESTALDAPLFLSQKTRRRISPRDFQRIVGEAGREALHRHVHPHMLRHTFATRLIRQNDPKVVQELLGHRSIYTTMIYDHPTTADHRIAIDTL